ncbi:MAG: hypothetical protein ACJAQ3_003991, partial [Planctomycetota bacterium]
MSPDCLATRHRRNFAPAPGFSPFGALPSADLPDRTMPAEFPA